MPQNAAIGKGGLYQALLERLIKSAGQNKAIQKITDTDGFEPNDEKFLHQFMHPEKDIFETQTLRPTQLTNIPNVPFRKFGNLKLRPNDRILYNDGPDSHPLYAEKRQAPLEPIIREWGGLLGDKGEAYGMGSFKKSIGKDEKGNPYLSIYDLWDFTSPHIGDLMGKLLNRVGQPYAIYDRYPLEEANDTSTLMKSYKFKE